MKKLPDFTTHPHRCFEMVAIVRKVCFALHADGRVEERA
jgi:hypothetical protein